MKLFAQNLKVHKAKQGKSYTNIMLLDSDDDLSFGVQNDNPLADKFYNLKGQQVDIVIDVLPKKEGYYLDVKDVRATNGKG
jgi:hypothetical protein